VPEIIFLEQKMPYWLATLQRAPSKEKTIKGLDLGAGWRVARARMADLSVTNLALGCDLIATKSKTSENLYSFLNWRILKIR
jgi:hypothetical protein